MRLVLLKTGHTYPDLAAQHGDFEHLFAAGLGRSLDDLHLVVAEHEDPLPEPGGVVGVIVTGSPASVYDHAPWSDHAGRWLWSVVEAGAPVLGVCYGHQLLGEFGGGRVALSPTGREIGVCEVTVDAADPLFDGLPATFAVYQTHRDAVLEAPPGARVIGSNAAAAIQAMAFGERARSVQWHPEFHADVMRAYITKRADEIDAERGPGAAARLLAAVVDLPSGAQIFRNFVQHFLRA